MKSGTRIQYTLRQVPRAVDDALRLKSQRDGKSINQTALEVLSQGLAIGGDVRHADLDFMVGSWKEDPAFDRALKAQDEVDADLWK